MDAWHMPIHHRNNDGCRDDEYDDDVDVDATVFGIGEVTGVEAMSSTV
jgi:hypothetical protein